MKWPWEEGAVWIIDPMMAFLITVGIIGIGGSLLGWYYDEKSRRQSELDGTDHARKRKKSPRRG